MVVRRFRTSSHQGDQTEVWRVNISRVQFKDSQNPTTRKIETMVVGDVNREEAALDGPGLLCNCAEGLL